MADSSFPRRPKSSGGKGRVLEFPSDAVPDGSAAESSERPREGQVVAFPRQPTTGTRPAVREPSGAHRRPQAAIEPPASDTAIDSDRPPYLASELLKEDFAPRYPFAAPLRLVALGGGVIASVIALLLGGFQPGALAIAGAAIVCAAIGLVPVRPVLRGWIVGAASIFGIGMASWRGVDLLLTVAGALMVGALLFRAAHRTSRLARVLVMLALATAAGWWLMSGGTQGLLVRSAALTDVLPPIATLGIVLLGIVTPLTFLDPLGTGGARRLAIGWWVAIAGQFGVSSVLELWPNELEASVALRLAAPIFVALAGLSLPQVVASLVGRRR